MFSKFQEIKETIITDPINKILRICVGNNKDKKLKRNGIEEISIWNG